MENEIADLIDKPKDWPINALELRLENAHIAVTNFINNPSYTTREVLCSVLSQSDLNEMSVKGLYRVHSYEVALINFLYFWSLKINLPLLRVFIYKYISERIIIHKSYVCQSEKEIKEYKFLFMPLKIFYLSFSNFKVYRERNFANELIKTTKICLKSCKTTEIINLIIRAYGSVLLDLSNFYSKKILIEFCFTRDELYNLFSFQSELLKRTGENPINRPLKGTLKMAISNYLLKSRNNYNDDFIYKYVDTDAGCKSLSNNELWMRRIYNLNDKREAKIVPQLFKNKKWLTYDWAKSVDFHLVRQYEISSFSKSGNSTTMQNKYGKNIYGYKNDRISTLLAPIYCSAMLGQVICFDVLYDYDEFKKEINFLCQIIDLFDMEDKDKSTFFTEIMQFWIFSVKDKKWEYEKERRYVLFLYDDYVYKEMDCSDKNYIRLKSTLLLLPDFFIGDRKIRNKLSFMIDEKSKILYSKSYYYCKNCLNRDFDNATLGKIEDKRCQICGSNNMQYVEK